MNLVNTLKDFFSRPRCKQLIVYNKKELNIGELSANVGSIGFKIGDFKVDTKKVQDASEEACAMDQYQFDLCQMSRELEKNDPFREQLLRMRVGAITLFTNLRMTLIAFKADQSKELSDELQSVIKDMRKFNKSAVTISITPVTLPGTGGFVKPQVKLGGARVSVGIEKQKNRFSYTSDATKTTKLTARNQTLSRVFKRAGLSESDIKEIIARA